MVKLLITFRDTTTILTTHYTFNEAWSYINKNYNMANVAQIELTSK